MNFYSCYCSFCCSSSCYCYCYCFLLLNGCTLVGTLLSSLLAVTCTLVEHVQFVQYGVLINRFVNGLARESIGEN